MQKTELLVLDDYGLDFLTGPERRDLLEGLVKIDMVGNRPWSPANSPLSTGMTNETGLPPFFCDPRSAWQSPTIENLNGVQRQYFPRSVELTTFSEQETRSAASELNRRPRRTLAWRTPEEVFTEGVASTA